MTLQLIELRAIRCQPPTVIYVNPDRICAMVAPPDGGLIMLDSKRATKIAGNIDLLPEPFCNWPLFHEVMRDDTISRVRVNPHRVVDISDPRHVSMEVPNENLEFPEDMPDMVKEFARSMLTKSIPLPEAVNAFIDLGELRYAVTETMMNARAMLLGEPIPEGVRP